MDASTERAMRRVCRGQKEIYPSETTKSYVRSLRQLQEIKRILARLAKLFLPMDDLDLAPGLPLSSSSLPYDTCGYIQYMFFQFL